MRNIVEIIKDAGGPRSIHERSGGTVSKDAVYKWPQIGIPDRHWPILMELAGATAGELFEANRAAREATSGREPLPSRAPVNKPARATAKTAEAQA